MAIEIKAPTFPESVADGLVAFAVQFFAGDDLYRRGGFDFRALDA